MQPPTTCAYQSPRPSSTIHKGSQYVCDPAKLHYTQGQLTYVPIGPAPPPQPPQGLCFGAPSWPWGIGEQGQSSPSASWTDAMVEGGDGGQAGLRFLLQFDPGRPGFDRTLLGVSLSALLSRLLGWSKDGGGQGRLSVAIAGEEGGGGGGGSGNAAMSAAALAAAVSFCLAAMYASDQRPRRAPPLPRQRRRLPAPDSAARLRALPAPDDGLRILSSNDESLENVIHGASIGAGDDEPDIVARVQMDTTTAEIVGANADDETKQDPSEQEERQELERQEHERLRELWLSLLEREQRLELRLQELEGLRAQVATLRELEGRVAAATVEERRLQLKVSTLQDENGRLRAQVEELDTARAELARAKEKLRAIKARVQAEQEEARREAAVLRAKVADLERGGEETAGALAAEIAELRKANAALEEENLELALRLQDAQQAASSVDPVLEEDMAEEARYLRESNERLTRQIEQLHNDHCAHVEELVYLKWVNACLRHELRDHDGHPTTEQQDHHHDDNAGAGDLSALELSKSMSFRSSERAKQLMLRYGHPGLEGFDPALFSPLHESVDGDGDERSPARNYYEPERSPYARSEKTMAASAAAGSAAAAPGKKAGPRKLKFLGNIKKLLPGGKRGHSSHGHGHAGRDSSRKAPAPSDEYLEKAMQWLSAHDAFDGGDHSYESTPLSSCARTPLSSVTTATTADSRARGGGGHSERGETTTRAEAGPTMARSRSDAGRSYGREASRYHALRPDHPAGGGIEPDGSRATEKREPRRRSEELRSPAVA
uniref:Protein CHUP1, chloroplastic n=1 Tax=Setaria italica TaxID=4555 RepID=K3XER9_SETIT